MASKTQQQDFSMPEDDEGSKFYTWNDAASIRVEGDSVTDFLQGYLTCDCNQLSASELTPTALCNVKGRVVASGWGIESSKSTIQLVVHQSIRDRVIEFLSPYARFSRCTLTAESGPVVVERLNPSSDHSQIQKLIAPLWSIIESSSTPNQDASNDLAAALIESRFALVSLETSEQFLPQMLGLVEAGAVDFDKGCYLGQEIVARAHHRGSVKRELNQFKWQGSAPKIGVKDDVHGTIISVADEPTDPSNTANKQGVALSVL